MSSKSKDVKVEIEIGQRDLELTTYNVSVTVPTNEAIVLEWLANQNAIDSLSTHLSKVITQYFQHSSNQIKETLANNVRQQKLTKKKVTKKKSKTDEKEETLAS